MLFCSQNAFKSTDITRAKNIYAHNFACHYRLEDFEGLLLLWKRNWKATLLIPRLISSGGNFRRLSVCMSPSVSICQSVSSLLSSLFSQSLSLCFYFFSLFSSLVIFPSILTQLKSFSVLCTSVNLTFEYFWAIWSNLHCVTRVKGATSALKQWMMLWHSGSPQRTSGLCAWMQSLPLRAIPSSPAYELLSSNSCKLCSVKKEGFCEHVEKRLHA